MSKGEPPVPAGAAELRSSPDAPPPRAAYLHVPFCRHRCGYCNFTLVARRDDLIDGWLSALALELAGLHAPREVETLYFGGGTPSHLPPDALRRLFALARQWLPLSAAGEITLEANPADLTAEKLDLLAELGVHRLSLGVQSFAPDKLQLLERDHRRAQIEEAAAGVASRFPSWSLDLIFGVPGETLDAWRADLNSALALQPQHISTYGLTVERGTSFYARRLRGELPSLPEDLEARMYELAIDTLEGAGLEHYEVSNFARPGYRSRHNQVYWHGAGYYAFGPGAARFVQGQREINHRSTTTYIQRLLAGESPVAEWECLPPDQAARERLVIGLRLREGVGRREFREQTGFEIEQLVGEPLRRYQAQGLLEEVQGRVRLTRRGLLISDALWPAFLQGP